MIPAQTERVQRILDTVAPLCGIAPETVRFDLVEGRAAPPVVTGKRRLAIPSAMVQRLTNDEELGAVLGFALDQSGTKTSWLRRISVYVRPAFGAFMATGTVLLASSPMLIGLGALMVLDSARRMSQVRAIQKSGDRGDIHALARGLDRLDPDPRAKGYLSVLGWPFFSVPPDAETFPARCAARVADAVPPGPASALRLALGGPDDEPTPISASIAPTLSPFEESMAAAHLAYREAADAAGRFTRPGMVGGSLAAAATWQRYIDAGQDLDGWAIFHRSKAFATAALLSPTEPDAPTWQRDAWTGLTGLVESAPRNTGLLREASFARTQLVRAAGGTIPGVVIPNDVLDAAGITATGEHSRQF